jgi:hypothetical protein
MVGVTRKLRDGRAESAGARSGAPTQASWGSSAKVYASTSAIASRTLWKAAKEVPHADAQVPSREPSPAPENVIPAPHREGSIEIGRGDEGRAEAPTAAPTPSSEEPRARSWSQLPLVLLPAEVADLLRTTRKAVYAMAERGELPGIIRPGAGRRLLVDRDVLLQSLRERRTASSGGSRR